MTGSTLGVACLRGGGTGGGMRFFVADGDAVRAMTVGVAEVDRSNAGFGAVRGGSEESRCFVVVAKAD